MRRRDGGRDGEEKEEKPEKEEEQETPKATADAGLNLGSAGQVQLRVPH
jgi:hypothetical protein